MKNEESASHIIQELRKIDLSEKESRCYMHLVRSGPLSVQKISRALRLTRPTTYRLLEKLSEKGLINQVTLPGKKTLNYQAKSPDELVSLLKIKKRHIAEQERELLRIISALRTDYYEEDNSLTSYGITEESIDTCLKDIMAADIKAIYVWHAKNQIETPFTRDTLALIYDTVRSRRGSIEIFEADSDNLDPTISPFPGTIIITSKVYIITADEISILSKASLREFLVMMIKSLM